MIFSKNKLGIMQGRLSPIIGKKIQFFPRAHWISEFKKINKLKIKNLEWTLDYKNIYNNPLFSEKKIKTLLI